jgi:hypothetical protein
VTHEKFMDLITGWTKAPMSAEKQNAMIYKIQKFSESQLGCIADKILENCINRPEVSNIWEAARDLGYLATEAPKVIDRSQWNPTDCRYCGGEGALSVLLNTQYVERKDSEGNVIGKRKEITLRKVWPLSASDQIEFEWMDGDFKFAFRCCCDAKRLQPSGWPIFDPNRWYPCCTPLQPRPKAKGFNAPLAEMKRTVQLPQAIKQLQQQEDW